MLTAIVALCALTAWAQGISYQAVLRDANGQIMANQEVKLRLSILNGATPVYQEEQTVTTTPQGIINIAIGEGNATDGTFADIDWSQAYDLRVEVDANESGTYAAMPTTPLRPVPQAYHAKWAENLKTSGSKGVTLEAQSTIDDDSLLFGVRNNKGDLVFAVYNNAVAVYVDTTPNGRPTQRAGFAVGGMAGRDGKQGKPLLQVDLSGTTVHVDDGAEATNGGRPVQKASFAVGGMAGRAGDAANYFVVTPDSTRVYVEEGQGRPTQRAGFAVGGMAGRAGGDSYMNITKDNYYIGHGAGKALMSKKITSTDIDNVFLGTNVGADLTTGYSNVFLGHNVGAKVKNARYSVFIGSQDANDTVQGNGSVLWTSVIIGSGAFSNIPAVTSGFPPQQNVIIGTGAGSDMQISTELRENGLGNVFVGSSAGSEMSPYVDSINWIFGGVNNNVAIGHFSGDSATGFSNTFLGYRSGYAVKGTANTFLGQGSGRRSDGVNNIAIGNIAMESAKGGVNIALGDGAGRSTNGNENIYIGEWAGYNVTGNSNLVIGTDAATDVKGDQNIYIGRMAGDYSAEVYNNIAIGYYAGGRAEGIDNIYIGNYVGYEKTENNVIRIGERIYAHDDLVELKGNVVSKDGTFDLGTSFSPWRAVYATNGTIQTSDRRLKTDIRPLENALSKIMKLNGITYKWRTSEFPKMNFDSKQHAGVIAQEVEAVLPEAVETGTDGYKSVSYGNLTPLLIEAIKEQQQTIDKQQQRIEKLEQLVEQLLKK